LEKPELSPILNDLLIKSSLPLAPVETVFAIDSTGLVGNRNSRLLATIFRRMGLGGRALELGNTGRGRVGHADARSFRKSRPFRASVNCFGGASARQRSDEIGFEHPLGVGRFGSSRWNTRHGSGPRRCIRGSQSRTPRPAARIGSRSKMPLIAIEPGRLWPPASISTMTITVRSHSSVSSALARRSEFHKPPARLT
jgi:hypothetical protein